MADKQIVIIIRESTLESVISDTYSIGALVGAVLLGWWIGSDALQWIAGIIMFLVIAGESAGKYKNKLTIEQARKRLDEIEADL